MKETFDSAASRKLEGLRDSRQIGNSTDILELRNHIKLLENEILGHENLSTELVNSFSWRITKPVRNVHRFLKLMRNKGIKDLINMRYVPPFKSKCSKCGEIYSKSYEHSPVKFRTSEFEEYRPCTVIVPVYGRLDSVDKLLHSLYQDPNISSTEVIVVDDNYDSFVTEWLNSKSLELGFILVKNEQNLGFGKSVNKAFTIASNEIVVLLNSDIILPPNSLIRFIEPFKNSKVALATALSTESGANLTISPGPGSNWLQLDSWLQTLTPEFPSACTAIGYALAIRKSSIGENELFDPAFVDGYGEDSDLHYRVVESGNTSVIIDNLLVFHESGASYFNKQNLSAIRQKNTKEFQKRWGQKYAKDIKIWENQNPVKKLQCAINQISFISNEEPIDLVLVLPSISAHAGGISVAFELASTFLLKGFNVVIYAQNKVSETRGGFTTLSSSQFKSIKSAKLVVATGIGTFVESRSFADRCGSDLGIFLQGPEFYFVNGQYASIFKEFLSNVDFCISVSPYLHRIAARTGAKNCIEIPIGPDSRIFYNTNLKKSKQVVIAARDEIEKGLFLALPLLDELHSAGWKIKSFGPIVENLKQFPHIEQLGLISPSQVAKLLNQSTYLIDFSLFEGLGLVPLEAIFCGVIPVMTLKGGTESILDESVLSKCIVVSNPHEYVELAKKLISITSNELEEFAPIGRDIAKKRNLQKGLDAAVDQLISKGFI